MKSAPPAPAKIELNYVRFAITTGNLEQLKSWKESNSLPRLAIKEGKYLPSPLVQAVQSRQFEIVKWLVYESGQKINLNRAVAAAAVSGEVEVIDWMVYHSGQEIDVTGALFNAVNGGSIDMIKWLFLKSGQEIKISDFVSVIAAEWASHGHPEIPSFLNAIKSLVEAGVSIKTIQKYPAILDAVEIGKSSASFIAALSSDDLQQLQDSKTVKRTRW